MFEFLAQGVKAPDIAGAQQQALTVAQLANQNEMSGLDLQSRRQMIELMKDPQYAAAMGAMLGGEQSGNGEWASLLGKYPAAAGPAMTQQLGMLKSVADIGKLKADTLQANTKAKSEMMQVLANGAAQFADQNGPLDPGPISAWVRTGAQLGAGPMMGGIIEAYKSGDEGALRNAFRDFASFGQNAEQRASAHEKNVNAGLAPGRQQIDAFKAETDALAKKWGGEWKTDVNGNMVFMRGNTQMPSPSTPLPTPGVPQQAPATQAGQFDIAPSVPVGAVPQIVADAQKNGLQTSTGVPATSAPPLAAAPRQQAPAPLSVTPPAIQQTGVQGALTPVQQTQVEKVLKPTVEEASKAASSAQEALRILPQLRATLAQGYTGTFSGSPVGKQLLNLAVTSGWLSPEQVQKFANTRMSDTLVTELLGPMAHSLSMRGMTNQSQKLIEQSKPGTENAPEVADAMITALQTDARNVVNYSKKLNEYINTNQTDYGLTGWPANAPKPELAPQGKGPRFNELPPANVANIGVMTDVNTGLKYRNRTGKSWELVQ